jgi:Holliday junction resolvasome RuvABC endonuclease subunit
MARLNRSSLAVLGVDPGTRYAGLVALDGHGRLLFRRQIVLNGEDPNRRLLLLHRAVGRALDRSLAAVLAVENPSHPRNARTAHLLGRAVGVCTLAACTRDLVVLEYRPTQIKAAIPDVRKRFRGCRGWTDDELAAAGAALLALREMDD